MNKSQIRRGAVCAAVVLFSGAVATASLLSWDGVGMAGLAVLLALVAVLLLDIRWRGGASAELHRAVLRETRKTTSRIGATEGTVRGFTAQLASLRERVERSERRVLGSVELANLQARDWRLDHDDAAAGRHSRLVTTVTTSRSGADLQCQCGGDKGIAPPQVAGEDGVRS